MKFYTTEGKIIAGFVFALLVTGFFSFITYRDMQLTYADSKEVETSLKLLKSVEIAHVSAQEMQAACSSFIINGDENKLIKFQNETEQCKLNIDLLVQVSNKDSVRLYDALALKELVNKKINFAKKAIEIRRHQGMNQALVFQHGDFGENLDNGMRALVNRIEKREREVLLYENKAQTERSQEIMRLFATLSILAFVFLLLCFLLIRNDSVKMKSANDRINYLADLIEQTSDAIISIDKNGIIISWNQGAVKMYGYTLQEALGKTIVELLKSNDEVVKLNHFLNHNMRGEYLNVEVIHQRKDLSKINVLSSIGQIKDARGKIIGVVGINKDISAQKKMQYDLAKFNDELSLKVAEKTHEIENIFHRITEGFVAIDVNHAFTYVNDNACLLINRKRQELIGKRVEEVFPEITDMTIYLGAVEALKIQESKQIEFFSPLLQKWIQSNIYPSPEGLSIFFHDVTEERKYREALIASEEKYRLLVEEASDAIFISDQQGNYIDVNPKACDLLGYTRNELLAINSKSILVPHHENDPSLVRYSQALIGKSFISERKLRRKDGSIVTVETNGKMLPDGRFMGIVRDITERKKTEQALRDSELRYRSLVEQASDSIILYDKEGNVIDVNTGACKMLGYSFDEMRASQVSDFFFSDDIRETPLRFKEQLEGKTVLSERNMKRKDGTSVPVEINSRMLADGLFLGIGRDITNRRQTERELKQINIRLRDLSSHLQTVREEERTNISREIHDELGQQLTALKMDASWLSKKLNGDEAIKEKVADMISLIDETVKTIRRISADLRPVILDDIGLIAALEWYCNEFEKRTGINCTFKSSFSELQFSKEMAICIFRICQETLTNIARHAKATQINISVSNNYDTMMLTVTDNGMGFDSSRIKEKKTLGILGMQERALMCNGEFSISSRINQGTVVTLAIPLKIEKHNQVAI